MIKKVAFLSLCSVTLAMFLAACGSVATTSNSASTRAANAEPASNLTNESVSASATAGSDYTFEFRTGPAEVRSHSPTTLAFTVKDRNGAVVKDLQIVHEKPMHLLMVSRDLAEFYHVHPELSPDGTYRVQHTFPYGGDYKLYADFTLPNGKQVVERVDVKVLGSEPPKTPLIADTKLEKSVDGLKVVMKPSEEIQAGKELTLDFRAFDAASGKPATDLQNYLGELAHFVIISEDMVDFVHAHPMSKSGSTGGSKMKGRKAGSHNADGHAHGDDDKTPSGPSKSEVSAHTTFPRAGLYKLWAQFQRGGNVISVPFVVNVPAGKAVPAAAADVPAGATKITVSSNGYDPASVTVIKGQPIRLAFYRADANNCGGEVIFAKRNLRKKLPVGKTVLVEFTPAEAGEIAFNCGMDMFRGKVVVNEN